MCSTDEATWATSMRGSTMVWPLAWRMPAAIFSDKTQRALGTVLGRGRTGRNPVDLGGDATAEEEDDDG